MKIEYVNLRFQESQCIWAKSSRRIDKVVHSKTRNVACIRPFLSFVSEEFCNAIIDFLNVFLCFQAIMVEKKRLALQQC